MRVYRTETCAFTGCEEPVVEVDACETHYLWRRLVLGQATTESMVLDRMRSRLAYRATNSPTCDGQADSWIRKLWIRLQLTIGPLWPLLKPLPREE